LWRNGSRVIHNRGVRKYQNATALGRVYSYVNIVRGATVGNRITYRFVVQVLDFACQIRRFPLQRGHVPGRFRVELRSRVLISIRFHRVDVTSAPAGPVLVAATMTLVRTPCANEFVD